MDVVFLVRLETDTGIDLQFWDVIVVADNYHQLLPQVAGCWSLMSLSVQEPIEDLQLPMKVSNPLPC